MPQRLGRGWRPDRGVASLLHLHTTIFRDGRTSYRNGRCINHETPRRSTTTRNRSVTEVVVRPPMRPRSMVDGRLHDRRPLANQERPKKAMKAVEQRQPQRQLAREDPHRAPGVADRLPKHRVPNPIRPTAHQPPEPRVLTFLPPPERHVVPGELPPQDRPDRRGRSASRRRAWRSTLPRAARKPAAVAPDCPTFARSLNSRSSGYAPRNPSRTSGVRSVEPSLTIRTSNPPSRNRPFLLRAAQRPNRRGDLADELRQTRQPRCAREQPPT